MFFVIYGKGLRSIAFKLEKQTIEKPHFKTLWIYLVFPFYGLNIRMYIRKLLVKTGNQYFKVKKLGLMQGSSQLIDTK